MCHQDDDGTISYTEVLDNTTAVHGVVEGDVIYVLPIEARQFALLPQIFDIDPTRHWKFTL